MEQLATSNSSTTLVASAIATSTSDSSSTAQQQNTPQHITNNVASNENNQAKVVAENSKIQAYLEIFLHSVYCVRSQCPTPKCTEFKRVIGILLY